MLFTLTAFLIGFLLGSTWASLRSDERPLTPRFGCPDPGCRFCYGADECAATDPTDARPGQP